MKAILLIAAILAFIAPVDARQDARHPAGQDLDVQADTLSEELQRYGTFEVKARSYFMSTVNHGDYPDYYAFALGAGLGYYSPIVKNFRVGLSGYFVHGVAASYLADGPPLINRYEIGLFDVANPENKSGLTRVEDLYLRYYLSAKSKSYLQLGKFQLKSPLINLQDGRMRPTIQEGLWAEWNSFSKIKIKGGWLWRTSPRSTMRWYTIGESIGLYPSGRATDGTRAAYQRNVETPGIAIANVAIKPAKALEVQLWDYHVPGLFNTALSRIEWRKQYAHAQWMAGVQHLWQNSLYNDTLSTEKQYIAEGETAHVFSARISRKSGRYDSDWSVNYTRITKAGRFLFPREWGIEPFYTFMYRERLEGSGDVHAVMLQNLRYLDTQHRLSLQSGGGLFWMPSTENAGLNKYAMPGFYQFNLRALYKFNGFLSGMESSLLYTYKGSMAGDLEELPVNYHNKVDMHHLSFVIDYQF